MQVRRFAVRATAVCGGVLLAGMLPATAYADTSPLPPAPSPGDLIGTVTQTVTTVTSLGSSAPATTTTTPTTTTKTTDTATAPKTSAPSSPVRQAPTATTARTATPRTVTAHPAVAAASFVVPALLRFPPQQAVREATVAPPVVAPLIVSAPHHATTAASDTPLPDRHSSMLRALLVALALAAAGGLGFEHVRLLHRRVI